jgi:hypothetical protein
MRYIVPAFIIIVLVLNFFLRKESYPYRVEYEDSICWMNKEEYQNHLKTVELQKQGYTTYEIVEGDRCSAKTP